MTDLEFNKLLNISLAELGLSAKLVTESSHMPTTGVIMTPRNSRQAQQPKDLQDRNPSLKIYKEDS